MMKNGKSPPGAATMYPRPKDGSRKADIFDVYMAKGYDPAHALAMKKDIKEGTFRSWASLWERMKGGKLPPPPPKEKNDAPPKIKETVEKVLKQKAPDESGRFEFVSREAAQLRIKNVSKQSGLKPSAFHILEHEGRFAVVPLHIDPKGTIPVPQFKAGDVVYDLIMPNSKAKITKPGPVQSELKYFIPHQARPMIDCVSNVYLYKFEEPKKTKIKREKL